VQTPSVALPPPLAVCSECGWIDKPASAEVTANQIGWTQRHFGCIDISLSRCCAVSRPKDGEDWPYSTGYISEAMIREHLFPAGPNTFAGICGPPAMVNAACLPNLKVRADLSSVIFRTTWGAQAGLQSCYRRVNHQRHLSMC
jgi:Oxidoreductase NAD-binding domain